MFYKIIKRGLDIVFSIFFLIILSPVLLILAILVLLFSGKPIIFKQKRVGLNGKEFYIYKFRSMIVGASKFSGKKREDELTTFIGKILRPSHLDELPQLFNILKSDMSFVGYRPYTPAEYKNYMRGDPKVTKKIHTIRPGLTGLGDVIKYIDYGTSTKIADHYHLQRLYRTNKRHQVDQHIYWHNTARYYAKHVSLALDANIILWTFILEIEFVLKILRLIPKDG